MSDDAGKDLSEPEALAAGFSAVRMFAIYSQASLFFTLAERGLIEPERLFAFNRTVAETFRQNARSSTAKIPARANAQIADMLDEFEAVLRNMATIPTGAGRA
jgi:hypothetical protein